MRAAILLAFATTIATTATAGPTLTGREVTFGIMTYDDPAAPLFDGARHSATVGEGPEFGLGLEGVQNDIDVVPVILDISDSQLILDYSDTPPSEFYDSAFNGYVLRFEDGCDAFRAVALNTSATTLGVTAEDITLDGPELRIHVGGLTSDAGSRVVLNVKPADCP